MVLKIVLAVVLGLGILWTGLFVLRAVGHVPPVPEPGELRKVNLRYRCNVCGAEVRMTSAPDELPAPPRHCMDEMDLVAPPIE